MRASGRLAVEQLSSLCTARKRNRGNRVRVDGAGSGEASDGQCGEDIADPRLAPKSGREPGPPVEGVRSTLCFYPHRYRLPGGDALAVGGNHHITVGAGSAGDVA